MPQNSSASAGVVAGAIRQANLRGAMFMVLAMFAFALEDVLLKRVGEQMPASQLLVAFGIGGLVVFWCVARARGERLVTRDALSPVMRVRFCIEIVARLFYILALTLTPLSATTAILQATPIVVVMGAAFLFGEKVGWRRWAASLVGLGGVMIVLRPGTDSFSPLSILAVIGMLAFAARDLASRAAPAGLAASVLGFYGYIAVIVAGLAYAAWERQPFVVPDLQGGLALVICVGLGTLAYVALMKAMRTGEVSVVAPFRYSRLPFGLALGVLVFGETLDTPMIVGSVVIVLSGLFILWRSRKARTTVS